MWELERLIVEPLWLKVGATGSLILGAREAHCEATTLSRSLQPLLTSPHGQLFKKLLFALLGVSVHFLKLCQLSRFSFMEQF
jgi:hypothetical protein